MCILADWTRACSSYHFQLDEASHDGTRHTTPLAAAWRPGQHIPHTWSSACLRGADFDGKEQADEFDHRLVDMICYPSAMNLLRPSVSCHHRYQLCFLMMVMPAFNIWLCLGFPSSFFSLPLFFHPCCPSIAATPPRPQWTPVKFCRVLCPGEFRLSVPNMIDLRDDTILNSMN